jgi:ribose/xylose/arabinose/galactoside ABC-type transport system permease subunit
MKTCLVTALKRHGILIVLILTLLAMWLVKPEFVRPANLLNILRQTAVNYGIMAVGMTLVILTGGIDLSVASQLALAGVLSATLEHAGWSVPVLVGTTLLFGCFMGWINGVIITKAKVTPFVVTLGTMSIARGVAHIVTDGQPISRFGGSFRFLGSGYLLSVPVPILLFLLTVVAAAVVLHRTRLGRYLYAIGGNPAAARLSGIAVDSYTTVAYVLCGLTAALAAIVFTARLDTAESIAATGFELDVVASVVIGGTSLMGGRGGVVGTLIGALTIGTINNAMNLLQITSYYQSVVKGIVIVAAVVLDRLRED